MKKKSASEISIDEIPFNIEKSKHSMILTYKQKRLSNKKKKKESEKNPTKVTMYLFNKEDIENLNKLKLECL